MQEQYKQKVFSVMKKHHQKPVKYFSKPFKTILPIGQMQTKLTQKDYKYWLLKINKIN